jgi:hypothetical protein
LAKVIARDQLGALDVEVPHPTHMNNVIYQQSEAGWSSAASVSAVRGFIAKS